MSYRSKPTGGKPREENELEKFLREMRGDGSPEEQLYLDSQRNKKASEIDFDDPAAVEAELRRLEYQRLQRDFRPSHPLYARPQGDVSSMSEPKKPSGKGSYQNDPRYRDFYSRLKQANTRPTTHYDEEVQPMSLEELDEQAWDGKVHPPTPPVQSPASKLNSVSPLTQQPQQRPQPQMRRPAPPVTAPAPSAHAGSDMTGSIMRFDDDSIGIYKDAVSGKDYALFYFLEPNGALAPRGIFLEQYEFQRIGHLPEQVFENMRRAGTWERDAIIFHLDKFDYAGYIRRLENRTPLAPEARPQRSAPMPEAQPRMAEQPRPEPRRVEPTPPPESPPPRDPLERGRVIRINVGGKVWEAVYWTKDEIGAIVAHDTNREWSLMHLDLTRFKDSLEYGDLLAPEKLSDIEKSLARGQ